MTYVRKGYARTHKNSVRSRLLDLLQAYDGEWFTLRALRFEYSQRFGPVKKDTLSRAVHKELEAADCEIWVRSRSDQGPQTVIEVAWALEIEKEEE